MGFWDSSGISWTTCKQSAPRSRQITTTPHHSIFTGRTLFLTPSQQRRSAAGQRIGIRSTDVRDGDFWEQRGNVLHCGLNVAHGRRARRNRSVCDSEEFRTFAPGHVVLQKNSQSQTYDTDTNLTRIGVLEDIDVKTFFYVFLCRSRFLRLSTFLIFQTFFITLVA